jgi:hypothetical protein
MMDNLRKTLGSFAMAALVFVGFIFIYNWSFSSFSTQLLLSHNESLCQQQSNMVCSNHLYFFIASKPITLASKPITLAI